MKEKILNAGLELWPNTSLQNIADIVGITHSGVLYHFPSGTLRNAIAKHAVSTGCSSVIMQLIASKDKAVHGMSQAEKIKHFNGV